MLSSILFITIKLSEYKVESISASDVIIAGWLYILSCGLSIISQAKVACHGDLSKIKSCVKLTGFVNSTDNFVDQPKVINPASETLSEIFGENGKHTRAAVSVNSLPLGASVEVDAIFEIE